MESHKDILLHLKASDTELAALSRDELHDIDRGIEEEMSRLWRILNTTDNAVLSSAQMNQGEARYDQLKELKNRIGALAKKE